MVAFVDMFTTLASYLTDERFLEPVSLGLEYTRMGSPYFVLILFSVKVNVISGLLSWSFSS